MLLEGVAIDFPDIQIVVAHPSWPRRGEALSLELYKPNAWRPAAGFLIQHGVLVPADDQPVACDELP